MYLFSITVNQTLTGAEWYFHPYNGLFFLITLISEVNNMDSFQNPCFVIIDTKFAFPFSFDFKRNEMNLIKVCIYFKLCHSRNKNKTKVKR
jgi:hypothetical protein